jgi:tetratricopeptide (TPR) repeat protein
MIQRVMIAALSAPVVTGLLAGCSAGHGEYTQAFKEQAESRMAEVKSGTSWDMAHQQYLSGDLRKSLDNVEKSIALNSTVVKSHLLRGKVLIELGRLDSAMGAFENVLALEAGHSGAQYYRGIIFERYNKAQEAFESYSLATRADPENAQYALACAETLITLGELDEAEGVLGVSGSFEHNAGIRQTLGHIARVRGDDAEAVKLFHDAYLLAPDDNGLLEDLARAEIDAGMFGEADRSLARLLKMEDMDVRRDLERLRVKCLVQLNQPVEARAILRRHVRDGDGASDVHTWIELGNIAMLLGDYQELRWAAGRVIALSPERHEGFLLMGVFQRHIGDLTKATRSLERSVGLAKSDPSALILLHLVYAELGEMGKAQAALAHASSVAPNDTRVQQLSGSFQTILAGVSVD